MRSEHTADMTVQDMLQLKQICPEAVDIDERDCSCSIMDADVMHKYRPQLLCEWHPGRDNMRHALPEPKYGQAFAGKK